MLNDIKGYVEQHPNEKILVCVVEHWEQNWSSKNWWSKENWLELANLSPNLKIWSIRCFFWAAFENEEIYNNKSSVSWFSNHIPTLWNISDYINEACGLWLWFHEMEIYTRLNYPVSVAPLTESMEYTNRNTWETEIWKIWLAQNDNQDIPNINYA